MIQLKYIWLAIKTMRLAGIHVQMYFGFFAVWNDSVSFFLPALSFQNCWKQSWKRHPAGMQQTLSAPWMRDCRKSSRLVVSSKQSCAVWGRRAKHGKTVSVSHLRLILCLFCPSQHVVGTVTATPESLRSLATPISHATKCVGAFQNSAFISGAMSFLLVWALKLLHEIGTYRILGLGLKIGEKWKPYAPTGRYAHPSSEVPISQQRLGRRVFFARRIWKFQRLETEDRSFVCWQNNLFSTFWDEGQTSANCNCQPSADNLVTIHHPATYSTGTHGIHAMAFISGETKAFSTENMSQMSVTAWTKNFTTSQKCRVVATNNQKNQKTIKNGWSKNHQKHTSFDHFCSQLTVPICISQLKDMVGDLKTVVTGPRREAGCSSGALVQKPGQPQPQSNFMSLVYLKTAPLNAEKMSVELLCCKVVCVLCIVLYCFVTMTTVIYIHIYLCLYNLIHMYVFIILWLCILTCIVWF